MKQYIKAETVY